MPANITCPECEAPLKFASPVPAGKKIKCPKCEAIFPMPEERSRPNGAIRSKAEPPPRPVRRRPPEDDDDDEDDDDRPSRRRRRPEKDNSALVIGLVIGGAALVLLVGGGLAGYFLLRDEPDAVVASSSPPATKPALPPALAGNGNPNPKPNLNQNPNPAPPVPPFGKAFGPDVTVTIRLTGIPDEPTRQFILDKLPTMTDGGGHWMNSSGSGGVTTVSLAPVRDPKAFAAKIDFGTVTSIDGRVIVVAAKKLDVPPASADLVTKALFDLKSPNLFKRKAAAQSLAKVKPNERRAEVAKELAARVNDPDHFTRQEMIKALGVWGSKDDVPTLIGLLSHQDVFTRKAAMEVLPTFKDERAAEAVAKMLGEAQSRFDASASLKAMGPVAEKSVLPMLTHNDVFTRMEACKILQAIGTKESVTGLQAASGDMNFLVSSAAKEALQSVNARGK